VEIYVKKANKRLEILKKGQYFGEYGFISGAKRKSSVRTLEFCELYVISRSDFIECLKSAT
jgi:CRP-like cAMP-binding protein